MRRVRHGCGAVLVAAWAGVACGGGDAGRSDTAEGAADTASSRVAETTAAGGVVSARDEAAAERALTSTDLDAYERAVQKEIDLVQAAVEKRSAATSDEERSAAMAQGLPLETEPVAARDTGIPVERYREVSGVIEQALSGRLMRSRLDVMRAAAGRDTASLPPEERARVRENLREMEAGFGDPFKAIPAELQATLERRAPRLDSLRTQLLALRLRLAQ